MRAEARRKELVVSQLMTACKNWLTEKGTKTTSKATERKLAVESLGEQAFQWIKWCKFHQRKADPGNAAVQKRAMRPGYQVERAMYMASGKARNPVSGSYIHSVMETVGTFRTRTFATLTPADFRTLDNAYVGEVNQPDPMGDQSGQFRLGGRRWRSRQAGREVCLCRQPDSSQCYRVA